MRVVLLVVILALASLGWNWDARAEQFVETFLCDARPIVHILPNSPFVAATAAVASPRTKAPAIADVTYDLIIVSSF